MKTKHLHTGVMFQTFLSVSLVLSTAMASEGQNAAVLKAEPFKHYVDTFNENDEDLYVQHVPNEKAWEFLKVNVPLFECPDKDLERT
ncbi:MAG: hypothetical protein ACYSYL_12575, partial [Planctomycetota bacterium]